MRTLRLNTIFIASVVLFVIAACSGGNTRKNSAIVDTVIEANYNKAYYYDFHTHQRKLAEMYYNKVYDALKNDPDKNRKLYTRAGYSLAAIKSMRMDFEGSMVIALDM